jgi:hypothetical protein
VIILSGVLVVVAIATLVAGIVAGAGGVGGVEGLTLIYISIGISVVSALCLLIGVAMRWNEIFGPTGAVVQPKGKAARAGKPGRAARKAQQARQAQAQGAEGDQAAPAFTPQSEAFDDATILSSQPADVPADAPVFVVRGRKRYHLETCRQLAGREKEELTYAEAREEGFSSCTACMPDTALAARAAVSVGESAGESTLAAGEPVTVSAPPGSVATAEETTASWAETPADGHPRDGVQDLHRDTPAHEANGYAPEPPAGDAVAGESGRTPTAFDLRLGTDPKSDADAAPATGSGAGDDPLSGGFGESSWETGEERPGRTVHDIPVVQEASLQSPPETSEHEAAAGGPQVRILSGTKRYHRSDCALIEDIADEAEDLETLPRDEAKASGCTPCLVCQPDKD